MIDQGPSQTLIKTLQVQPGNPLLGQLSVEGAPTIPGDKSLSHRAALFAAMALGRSQIDNFLVSGVTEAMLQSLGILGVPWELQGSRLIVHGRGLAGWNTHEVEPVRLDCGNSATTLRLLAGALAAWGIPALLDGSQGLCRRPMKRIVQPLAQMGVAIQSTDGCAPLMLSGRIGLLKPLDYALPVASAQVKSCLLLAGLAADGETILREPGPSRDHTERMLRGMGVTVVSERQSGPSGEVIYQTRLEPPRSGNLSPLQMTLPGDISAAAFVIVAALITPGSQVTLQGVGLNPTRTGLLDALLAMGADLQITPRGEQGGEPLGDLLVRHSNLHGVEIGGDLVVRMIDEFPVFAVAAACANGCTRVSDASELRHKESDRISALSDELRLLGVQVEETPDGFIIQGGQPLKGGLVHPHGDHRLAMSLAVSGLVALEPVTVQNAAIIHESFPDFAAVLRLLGGQITETT